MSLIQIPASALPDVQEAFRSIQRILDRYDGQHNIDLHGRRVMNAGVSVNPADYVTKGELSSLQGGGTGSTPTLPTTKAGTGITISLVSGVLTITNAGVTSAIGTSNRVSVSGATGAVTFSTPQDTHTGASPQFSAIGLGTAPAQAVHAVGQIRADRVINQYALHLNDGTALASLSATVDAATGGKLTLRSKDTSGSFQDALHLDSSQRAGFVSTINTYNNIATAGQGVSPVYAVIDSTGLTANVGASTLYAVPASGAGLYRISALIVETTAGSVSSTLPNLQIVYTDQDTSGSITLDATPILGGAGLGQTGALTGNTAGLTATGVVMINAKASTTIQYQTVNYASVAAGMAYTLRIRLEAA